MGMVENCSGILGVGKTESSRRGEFYSMKLNLRKRVNLEQRQRRFILVKKNCGVGKGTCGKIGGDSV